MDMTDFQILKEGYSISSTKGEQKADCTISLICAKDTNIIVDTGGPWNKEFLMSKISDIGISLKDIDYVIGTHGHSDHIGNLNLFETATVCVSYDICKGDTYFPNSLAEGVPYKLCEDVSILPTPGHTGSDISVVAQNTKLGTVVFAGDLFECEEDLDNELIWKENSENPILQFENRKKVLTLADCIVPGHGKLFKVEEKYKS